MQEIEQRGEGNNQQSNSNKIESLSPFLSLTIHSISTSVKYATDRTDGVRDVKTQIEIGSDAMLVV